ncbi:hypothetical protein [Sandaracinus amylolyticus]|uniref:Uncharacterized protein n=1 Tax=Sandaracinus amylolyticus TaxID=927083 RepID=A0A0F6W6Q2_9BACT|nr:hypothetical protein [Sandaracinus amylolyticus]AKF08906.1 hypothetical protein DB32_006055 [Sandaracinus amylolyticus]
MKPRAIGLWLVVIGGLLPWVFAGVVGAWLIARAAWEALAP